MIKTARWKVLARWFAVFSTVFSPWAFAQPDGFVGIWSAPSLSRPAVPIVISLRADGTATERIGKFEGVGTWKNEAGAARIFWASGWVGLLQALPDGTHRLLTWKATTPPQSPPDDIQPAERIGAP